MVSIDTTVILEKEDRFAAEFEFITETIVKPIVRRSLRTTLSIDDTRPRNQDALELVGDIQVMLMAAVSDQNDNGTEAIRDLRGYAARIAANACYLYFRTNFPERARQENKLRYALKHLSGVSIWKADDGRWLCGSTDCPDLNRSASVPIASSNSFAALETREGYLNAVRSILDSSGGPVLFDELVDLFMDILGIRETNTVSIEDGRNGDQPDLRSEKAENTRIEWANSIGHLKRVWRELGQMRLRDRKVLLLNLKYKGGDLLRVLPLCGIASIRDIAVMLEFTDLEFAEILRSLPWDDRRIADHLGITRQQVINLRRYVRSRLFRLTAE